MNMISTKTLWERCKELGEKKTQLQDVILVFEHDEYIFLYDGNVLARVSEKSVQGSQWLAEAILTKFEGEAMLDKFGRALRESRKSEPVIPYRDADSSYVQISNNTSQDQIKDLFEFLEGKDPAHDFGNIELMKSSTGNGKQRCMKMTLIHASVIPIRNTEISCSIADTSKDEATYLFDSPMTFDAVCHQAGFVPQV